MEMEFTTMYNNGNTFQSNQQSNNNPRILDDFCIDSLTSRDLFLQEFQHLDDQHFSITGSSFNPDIGIQAHGYDDPFDPFSQRCLTSTTTTKIDVHEFNDMSFSSFGGNGAISGNSSVMQNFEGVKGGGGLFGYLNKNISMDYNNNGYSDLSLLSVNNYQDVEPLTSFVVPDDESSCFSTAGNSHSYKGNTSTKKNTNNTTNKRQGRGRKSNTTKGQWCSEEDRLLIKLVEKHGVRRWSLIAQILEGRIGKQCRERLYNHLRPNIKKDGWSDEEDKILMEVHEKVGNKWAEIAKSLPTRTENSIKNHWNATKRRQFPKRPSRTKKTPNSSLLLQDYIKSLNLDKKSSQGNKRYTKRGTTPLTTLDAIANTNNDGDDRLVPDYDFDDEIPKFEFPLDNKMFEESGIESLMIHDLPTIQEDDGDEQLMLWS